MADLQGGVRNFSMLTQRESVSLAAKWLPSLGFARIQEWFITAGSFQLHHAPPTGLLTIEEKRTQHKICIHQAEYLQESLLLRSESDADLSVNSGEDKPLLLLTGV